MYAPWAEALAPHGIEVLAVQPPGREDRLGEPLIEDLPALVRILAEALPAWLSRPYALFGHSLGALVAFEVARHLPRWGLPAPQGLIVSARRAPQLGLPHPPVHAMSREAFIEELRRLGGTPSAVLEERELMELLEPMIRADLRLTETYAPGPVVPLAVPIVGLIGADDPRVSVPEVDAWADATADRFARHVLPGGHFFLQDRSREVLDIIREHLSPTRPEPARERVGTAAS